VPDLQILTPDGKRRTLPLTDTPLTLGRAPQCELSYPDDAGLSRQHLTIAHKDGTYVLTDLGSKNGTVHNGKRVTAATPLSSGDRMMAGHLILSFLNAASSSNLRASSSLNTSAGVSSATVIFTEAKDEPPISAVTTDFSRLIQGNDSSAATKYDPVSALIRAGNELSGSRPLNELFPFILQLAMDTVGAQRGVLFTLEGDALHLQATQGEGFRISSSVRDRVLNNKESLLVSDTFAEVDLRESHSLIASNITTLMAVPLQTRDAMVGLIYVDSPTRLREFTKDDLNLLTVMANVAAIRIEQSRFAEMEKTRELLERELNQAAAIQRQYLPSAAPDIPGLDLAGFNAACRTVGGDYFGFFPYPDGSVTLVLGDVSGKGMPASLMMMGLQARAEVLLREPCHLAEALTRLNFLTAQHCPAGRFITLFLCCLHPKTGTLKYANAGHNPPVIIRADGSSLKLTEGGPVLGILPNMVFDQYEETLQPGDLLAIYSDGVTEAATPADEEFETENLTATLLANRERSCSGMIESVTTAVTKWTEGAPPADDVTIVLARMLPVSY
jgi:sigma-B regulation protein RsbU (phosphoserine phosphatase)